MMRRLFGFAVTLVIASSTAACGGPMSVSDGEQAANQARRPVAETYWKLYRSLDGAVNQTDGRGGFIACPDQHKNSVIYKIYYPFFATSPKEPQKQLTATVRTRLSRIGWNLRPSSEHVYSGSKNEINVQLREIVVDASGAQADALYVQSACTDVGDAQGVISRSSDQYRESDAASAPVPTAFPTQ
jgi:hypothetical protein